MLLVDARIHGYRRFGGLQPHKLLLDGRMVCLIGANEAGKSSILQLLEGSHDTDAIASTDRSRQEGVEDDRVVVRLRYRLDDAERAAVAEHYATGGQPTWLEIVKRANGEIRKGLEPWPRRDRGPRASARAALADQSLHLVDDDGDPIIEEAERQNWLGLLGDKDETLKPDVLNALEAIVDRLPVAEDGEDDVLAITLKEAIAAERAEHPAIPAAQQLWRLSPDFVAFDADARDLHTDYELSDRLVQDPPAALRNLSVLAELDLPRLLNAINAGETGTVAHLKNRANDRLRAAFESWTQHPQISVTIDTNGTVLLVHVASGEDTPMRFDERSEGLRQFVALVAATAHRGRVRPILLIDEVEMHLHYDAQSDLIRVLESQDAVSQIIYSTHSAACLPDDLGSVRVIEPDPRLTKSTIRQHFWSETPGLSSLLMAMGAASLAFVPRRPALVAEGPSELILLATLLRQATGQDDLGYQVAPGSSSVRPGSIIGLDMQAPRTAWVVDGDAGGAAIATKLRADGIDDAHILTIGGEGSGLALEDLVDRDAHADAINAVLQDIDTPHRITAGDLIDGERHGSLVAACTRWAVDPAPSKVAVANRLLLGRSERRLVAAEHEALLQALHLEVAGLVVPVP